MHKSKGVINKFRTTINTEKNNPSVPAAVPEIRRLSNSWEGMYGREKSLFGQASFKGIYSTLNVISHHGLTQIGGESLN